jgi:hypothetical protein
VPADHDREPDGPAHLVPLDGGWALWRCAAVRGAGLPVDWLAGFAPSGPDGSSTLDSTDHAAGRLLGEDAFVAALTWQNPDAVRNWVGAAAAAVRADPAAAAHLTGKRAALLARYAQRYCAKNETIGFFGGVGWARLDPDGGAPIASTGTAGVRRYTVHFELWAIEALAGLWSADLRLMPYLPVRRHAATSVDGAVIRRPFRPPMPLTGAAAAVLAAIDGRRRTREVVRAAAAGCGGAEAAGAELVRLRDAGAVEIGFALRPDERPEAQLREQVDRVDDPRLRAELVASLDELAAGRDRVAGAALEPTGLAAALRDLETTFSKLTALPAVQHKPRRATGRTTVYLDSRRDLDARLGAPLLDALRAPLRLLLDSARWFTAELAEAVDQALAGRYQQLLGRQREVTLAELYFASADVLAGAPGTLVHDVAADLRERWAEIIPAGPAEEIRLSSADIAPLVAGLFPDRAPGWTAARYHCPDLMLARVGAGPDGGTRYRWVLGELHLAMNTLENRVFLTQCDRPAELVAAVAADMRGGRIVPTYPLGPQVDPRRYPPLAVHLPDRYVSWSFGGDAGPPGGASIPATALVVEPGGQGRTGLLAGPRGQSWRAPVREFLGEFLSALAVNRFSLRRAGDRQPRVLIDDVVVHRAAWRIPVAGLAAAAAGRGEHRPERLAGLLRERGVPRFAFVRTPLEAKPFYLDLRAPLMLRNLSRAVRALRDQPAGGSDLELTEMLPGPDELWLTDPHGRRYTSEFRIVAVDQSPAPPLGLPGCRPVLRPSGRG